MVRLPQAGDTGAVAVMLALVLAVAVPVALALYVVSLRLAPMLAR